MSVREALTAGGVVAAVLGLLAVARPDLLALGAGRVVLFGIATAAMLGALTVARRRARATVEQADTGTPEEVPPTPVPGATADALLARLRDPGTATRHDRDDLLDRLEAAAVGVLTSLRDHDEAAARRRIADGAWTDDEYAASFFASEHVALPDRPRLAGDGRVSRLVSRETRFQRLVRHTIDAIAERAGVVGETDGTARWPFRDAATTADADTRPSARGAGHERESEPGDGEPTTTVRHTGRWQGVGAVALLAIALGLALDRPPLLLAAVVGVGFAGLVRTLTPRPVGLRVERSVSDPEPVPGDEVTVTLEVRNVSGRTLPDLRLVDGVPEALRVTDGSPRAAVALRPGRSATLRYTVTARRGEHAFDPVHTIARDALGVTEQERHVPPVEPASLTCQPRMEPLAGMPLRPQAEGYAGRIETDTGGTGVEFYATREYRRGDPTNRIDWHRRARTGELATMLFREERVADVMVVVDTRAAAYRAATPEGRPAADRAVDAAARILRALHEAGNRAGLTATRTDAPWLEPGAGRSQRAHARELLTSDPAFAPLARPDDFLSLPWLRAFNRRIEEAQVVYLSPLADDVGELVARWLDGYGYPVTVVSPDPTTDGTLGQRLARVERTLRLADLRRRGVPVVDWERGEALSVALGRAEERSSQRQPAGATQSSP